MKYIKKLVTILIMSGSMLFLGNPAMNADMSAGKPDKMAFSINDEDLDLLESMGFTRDQAQEMATMVNNLSAEEQQALAQIGQEIEKEMKNAGIDPNNPEDLFNYFSNLEQGTAVAQPAPTIEKEWNSEAKPESKPTQPKIQPINPKASADITILLEELLSFIASLRQKASSSMQFSHKLEGPLKQELDELTYYLHVLNKEALKPFIIAKEATQLHKALLKLHEILATYEPLIQTKTSFEDGIDDPYKTLNLEFGASNAEIKQTFTELKEKYDPAIIQEQLIEIGMNAKDIARNLKEAKLHFSSIKGAFESLSNPQEKAQIDKALMNRKIQKQESAALSEKAFTQCSSAITNAFYQDNLIKQIQDLLAKYAPEEKKKADEWEKTMKATLENQKKLDASATSRAKSSQTQGVQGLKSAGKEDETGKRFWDSYRPLENKGGFKGPSKNFGSNDKGSGKKSDSPSSGSKGGDSKGGGGSKGGGSPAKKPDAKKDDKKPEGKKITLDEKDFAKATSLASLLHPEEFEKLKKVAFKDDKLLQPSDYKQKDTIKNVFFDELPKALMLPYEAPKKGLDLDEANKQPSTLDKIDAFMKEFKIDALAEDYTKLGKSISDAKKEEVEAFKPVWQSFTKDAKGVVASIKHLLQHSLGFKGLDNTNGLFVTRTKTSKINRSQIAHHKLGEEASKTPAKPTSAPKGPLKPTDAGYLKYVKTTLTTIVEQFEKLDGKLGAKPSDKKDAPKSDAPKNDKPNDKPKDEEKNDDKIDLQGELPEEILEM